MELPFGVNVIVFGPTPNTWNRCQIPVNIMHIYWRLEGVDPVQ